MGLDRQRRLLLVGAVGAAAGLVLAGCASSSTPGASAGSKGSNAPYHVLAIYGMTGALESSAVAVNRGAQAAVEYFNSHGGVEWARVFRGPPSYSWGPNSSTALGNYALVFYGGFLILMAVVLPRGAAGLVRAGFDRLRTRRGSGGPGTARPADGPPDSLPVLPGRTLVVDSASKTFGGKAALREVSFTAEPGRVVALIGPNGSGKTTLLNIVSGYYKLDQGSVSLGGLRISGLTPSRVANAGVARTFQTPLVASLSVRQNVVVARARHTPVSIVETMARLQRFWRASRLDQRAVDAILGSLGLRDCEQEQKQEQEQEQALPLGTRRLVELARALASQPSVLLLDEVASGLDDEEVAGLSRMIREVAGRGGTVILVEHNFSLVQDLADHVVVLSQGRVVVADTPEVISRHPEVLHHYLGQKMTPTRQQTRRSSRSCRRRCGRDRGGTGTRRSHLGLWRFDRHP